MQLSIEKINANKLIVNIDKIKNMLYNKKQEVQDEYSSKRTQHIFNNCSMFYKFINICIYIKENSGIS